MSQLQQLNPTQITIIKGKVAGKKNATIGKEAFPNQKESSAVVSVSKELKKPNVQEELQKAFERHGITIDAAVEPISAALRDKDLDMQLKGSDRALKLMLPKDDGNTFNFNFINSAREDYQ